SSMFTPLPSSPLTSSTISRSSLSSPTAEYTSQPSTPTEHDVSALTPSFAQSLALTTSDECSIYSNSSAPPPTPVHTLRSIFHRNFQNTIFGALLWKRAVQPINSRVAVTKSCRRLSDCCDRPRWATVWRSICARWRRRPPVSCLTAPTVMCLFHQSCH
ncbi:hypothetical protein PENTCL1PPCAC_1652, partial [Pristionchus entomophagus]